MMAPRSAAYEKARAVQFSRGVMQRLAAAYRAEGQSQKAGEVIAAYLAYNPSDMIAARMLGYHLIDRGDWAGALPWLLKARLRIGWGDSALNANIARTLSGLGRNAEALRMARLAYRADPANAMTTRVYGNMLLKSGEVRAARDLLRKAAKLMPEDRKVAAEYKAAIATAALSEFEQLFRADAGKLHLRDNTGPDIFQEIVALGIAQTGHGAIGNKQPDAALHLYKAIILKQLIGLGDC